MTSVTGTSLFFIQPNHSLKNLDVLGTKPTLVLVLRIGKDLGDATLGGLLGGLSDLCRVNDLTMTSVTSTSLFYSA